MTQPPSSGTGHSGDASVDGDSLGGDSTRGASSGDESFTDTARDRLAGSGVLDDLRDDDGEIALGRREALAYAGGAGVGLGGWKALHNVVLGYGVLAGTNVRDQDTAALVDQHFEVRSGVTAVSGYEVWSDGDSVGVYTDGERLDGVTIDDDAGTAERIDATYGLDGSPVAQLQADMRALADNEVSYEFFQTDEFLERVTSAAARPFTVDALRGPVFDSPDAEFVGEFADVDPRDAGGLVQGLKDGFREYSYYDVPRYAAGSVEDNILLGAVDLRKFFESPTDFHALANGENSGLFCTELVNRSIEAFHTVPATEQSPPIVAGCVYDERHKHSYTVLASAIRDDDQLVIPATFVDYTHSTLYDDLHLRWLLGEGVEAYNDRHRVTEIFWNSYASV
ncbi:hypothetical protein L593_01500 [Salinarchaeum sp. Harcht-Bsk1]|uniref:hypothetical protein n=1 Tax=Salinarchaeum sp. Harcht-Bsk1 TaxID=1333523 RepID=UPI0003423BB8|nr:hypothetical protein [Salinarchaeum sp. Harcht-Bsk1]AGN00253.1 hypothetical protein L593_01500 [Salinarchaeum sp. Harcht-Bsk1]